LRAYPRYLGYVRPRLSTASAAEYEVTRKLLVSSWRWRLLEAPVGRRILAVSPHPDDESIGAGGLLWAHRDSAEIHLLAVCDGGGGSALSASPADPAEARKQLVAARRAELEAAAARLKAASVEFLGFPDGGIPCSEEAAQTLRSHVARVQPDVILLPWFLDNHHDHRRTNVVFAWGCQDFRGAVLSYEIWRLLEPNAGFDIGPHLEGKLGLIRCFESQLRSVDYLGYVSGLARVRAYHQQVAPLRAGAVEAFVALPCVEYCHLVRELYGPPGQVRPEARRLLGLE
jgi:LmbE family N-acetylglucosaminyl deacetylase